MKSNQRVNSYSKMFRRVAATLLYVAGKQKELGVPFVMFGGHHSYINFHSFRMCPVVIPLKSKEISSDRKGQRTVVFGSLKISDKTVIIDVRGRTEVIECGKISGTISIPLQEVEYALSYLSEEEFKLKYGIDRPLPDTPLVFVCNHGMRSSLAQQTAIYLGFKNVRFARFIIK